MKEWKQLWLSWHPVKDRGFGAYAGTIVTEGFEASPVIDNSVRELQRGLQEMLGAEPETAKEASGRCIRIRREELSWIAPERKETLSCDQQAEAYRIQTSEQEIRIEAAGEKGILYGTFALLRSIALEKSPQEAAETAVPSNLAAHAEPLGQHDQ